MSKILEKKLSYKLVGAFIGVRKEYGLGHKERVYQQALLEEMGSYGIKAEAEKEIPIYSRKTKRKLASYRPDLIVEEKIIVELEVFNGYLSPEHISRTYHYLRNSKYEIGYIVNFGPKTMHYKRLISTNNKINPA